MESWIFDSSKEVPHLTEEEVVVSATDVDSLVTFLNSILNPFGFEASPFLISWYNEYVSPRMKLAKSGNPSMICICIISNPTMFDNSFLPHVLSWLQQAHCLSNAFSGIDWPQEFTPRDPLDRSVYLRLSTALQTLVDHFKGTSMEAALMGVNYLPDYALRPVTHMPVVHVTTAGHVSGVAHFHSPAEAITATQAAPSGGVTGKSHKLVGCSLHPFYGGWFGYRGIFLFPRLICPELKRCKANSSLSSPFQSDVILDLLTQFTFHWRDNKWRDFGLTVESEDRERKTAQCRYSLAARLFFNTACKKRPELLQLWARDGVPTFNLINP